LHDEEAQRVVRFGTRDELHVRWSRDGGEPGAEQHGSAEG
jgi:hypothetical protein